jgi:hypothetical protein
MMPVLPLQITDAGRAAMIDPVGGGTRAVTIAAAGLSQTDFVAAPTLEALPGEFKRVPTVSGQTVAPDTVHLTLRDDSVETYALRGFGLYLSDGTLFAVHSEPDPILEKAAFATLLLAFDWTLAASDAAAITFGDTSFLNPRPPRRSPGWSNWPALPKRLQASLPTRRSRLPRWARRWRAMSGARNWARRAGWRRWARTASWRSPSARRST